MWAFFSSMTNKVILEFQSRRHHLNCIGFLYWNQFCLNPNQVEKWHLPQGVSQRSAWMLALVGSQEKTIQLSLFNCQLSQRGAWVLKRRTIRLQLSLFPDKNKAKKTEKAKWILLVFQTVALLSVAWLALTISTAVICFILRFLLLLVLRSSSKKIILPIYTQRVPFKRGAHRILYLREAVIYVLAEFVR